MAAREQVEKCARLLSRKSTDDEKFAGLLLLPRVVDAQDAESWSLVFDAMDMRFIERLLRTGLKQSEDNMLLNIAVSIIDVLASHTSIATSPRMLERIPTLCAVAVADTDTVSAEARLALCRLLSHDAAVEMLLELPDSLAQIVSAAKTSSEPKAIAQFVDYALNRCSQVVHTQCIIAERARGWVSAVTCVAAAFEQSHTILKFELISALANALEPIATTDAAVIDEQTPCLPLAMSISAGCIGILKQKSETTAYADQALALYSHLVRLWPRYVFSGLATHNTKADAVDKKEAELVLRLACVEGQASLDAMMIAPPSAGTHEAAEDCKRIRRGWKLPVCAEIAAGWLEWVARWLDELPPDSPNVNEAAIYTVMNEVQKLATAVIGFLVDWKERTRGEQAMLANGPELTVSTVHFLAQWLATDPKLHRAAMPVLPMCTAWILGSSDHSDTIAEYVRPCISFALETCGISEAQYADDLMTHELHHDRTRADEFASPWVGTIEFDDLARAVYSIPSDEDMLRDRQS
ncbi:hypothetical protein IWW55_001828 [Coemansia sp. RSA 2706]|nr:hypothetical protein IWW55_001828 [Coemansia sp. RSA 2706]KAJ2318559.1 hypothetical protein IWW52_002489 [Coemansia sp. RSA 2704]